LTLKVLESNEIGLVSLYQLVCLCALCFSVTMLYCFAEFGTRMKIEGSVNLKFLLKLNKTPTECFQLLKDVYGDNVMTCMLVFEGSFRQE
jgi:hypothetical protein